MPIYLRAPQIVDWRRLLAFAAIAGVHLAALGSWSDARKVELLPLGPTMRVTFVAQAPEVMQATPAPPMIKPRPIKPKPRPKVIATQQEQVTQVLQVPDTVQDEALQAEAELPSVPTLAPASSATPAIVPPNFVAAYLNNPGPHYPRASIRAREHGTVMLMVRVGLDGRAGEVSVQSSSGYLRLDEAAVDVVRRRWRFVPARQGDRVVAAWVRVPITFELKQQR